MTLRFGTDGVRGRAGTELTPEFVRRLGAVAAELLGGDRFLVGRDTRESGPMFEAALLDGLSGRGVAAEVLGVVPTPAVAWLSAADRVPAAMISASHNAYTDNGIKLFAAGGRKLTDAEQERIQAALDATTADAAFAPVSGPADESTRAPQRRSATDIDRYCDAVVASIQGRDLAGLHIVIDCANGSATTVASRVLRSLGATVDELFAEPDGRNINTGCGSTHPDALQRAVVARGAHLGLAFDGDADRVLAVDAGGALVDGDQIIAVCAIDRKARGQLRDNTVVVTVMTNLGFRLAMRGHGIDVVETAVGDRYVLEALEAGGFCLGGEQSGHIIFRDLATTGDGLLTGVQLADVVQRTGRPLADLATSAMERLPQVLHNVRVAARVPDLDAKLEPVLTRVRAALGERGRVLIRPSGTEPLIRVMVEAGTREDAEDAAALLVAEVNRTAGSEPKP